MSSSKQRKARQKAEREQWEREQTRLAAARRRRTVLLGGVGAVVAVASVGLVVTLVARDSPDPSAQEQPGQSVELAPEEAAGEAQASAAAEAVAAGEVLADDYTVAPGTPVDSGVRPPADDRPVACGAKAPANARATRPRFPGGPADVLRDGVDTSPGSRPRAARLSSTCWRRTHPSRSTRSSSSPRRASTTVSTSSATSAGSRPPRPAAATTPSAGTSATGFPTSWTAPSARAIRSGR